MRITAAVATAAVKPGQTITFKEKIHKVLRDNMEQNAGHNVPSWIEWNPAQLTARELTVLDLNEPKFKCAGYIAADLSTPEGIDAAAEKVAAAREADGKAIGSACRHAGRAIEDCFAIYKKADRAAVFAGWRDMNDYMRENKIEPVPPQLAAQAKGTVAEMR